MNPTPQQLQALRAKHNLTVAAMAELLGVAKVTVESWLYGRRTCPATTYRLLNILLENRK